MPILYLNKGVKIDKDGMSAVVIPFIETKTDNDAKEIAADIFSVLADLHTEYAKNPNIVDDHSYCGHYMKEIIDDVISETHYDEIEKILCSYEEFKDLVAGLLVDVTSPKSLDGIFEVGRIFSYSE